MLGKGKSAKEGIGDALVVQALYQPAQGAMQASFSCKESACFAEHLVPTLP